MKKSRFTEEQIAFAIKQHELDTWTEEICRKMGISDATFYKWMQKYAGQVRPLRLVFRAIFLHLNFVFRVYPLA